MYTLLLVCLVVFIEGNNVLHVNMNDVPGSREWLRLVSNVQHFNGKWLGIQALRDDWWALIYSLPYFSFASTHTNEQEHWGL